MQKKHLGRMLCSFALSALTLWGVSVTTAAKDARAALRSLREESLGVMLLRYERGDGGEEYLSMQTSLALRAAPLLRGEDERIAQAWSTELTQKPDDGAAGDAQDNEGTVLTQEKTPDEVAVTENGVPARTLKASDPSGYTVFGQTIEGKDVIGGDAGDWNGTSPASEPEVRAVQEFLKKHPMNALVSIHTNIQAVLYPWCYRNIDENNPQDADLSFMP